MTFAEFAAQISDMGKDGIRMVNAVRCADGFRMSVQASRFHYCTPRETLPFDCYSAYEVGYPSERDEALIPYIEQMGDDPLRTVYPYVPVEVIEDIVERHGGIKAR